MGLIHGKISIGVSGGVISQIETRIKRRFEAKSGVKVEELQAQRDLSSKERIKRTFESISKFGITPPYIPPPPGPDRGP